MAQPQGLQEQRGFLGSVPLPCRHPWGHTGTYGIGRAGGVPALRKGWDGHKKVTGPSKRWPGQSLGDIPTGRLAKHHAQLAGAGGCGGGFRCPMALSWDKSLAHPRGGSQRGRGRQQHPVVQEYGDKCVGVKAPAGWPATPTVPQPQLPGTAIGQVRGLPRSAATTAVGAPVLCPSTHPLWWQQAPALQPMPCSTPCTGSPQPSEETQHRELLPVPRWPRDTATLAYMVFFSGAGGLLPTALPAEEAGSRTVQAERCQQCLPGARQVLALRLPRQGQSAGWCRTDLSPSPGSTPLLPSLPNPASHPALLRPPHGQHPQLREGCCWGAPAAAAPAQACPVLRLFSVPPLL